MNLTELTLAELVGMQTAINAVTDRFEPELVDDDGIYKMLDRINTELDRRNTEAVDAKRKLAQVEQVVNDFIKSPTSGLRLCEHLFDVLWPDVTVNPRRLGWFSKEFGAIYESGCVTQSGTVCPDPDE